MSKGQNIRECVTRHLTGFPPVAEIQTAQDREKLASVVEKNIASAELQACLPHIEPIIFRTVFQSHAARLWLESPDGRNERDRIGLYPWVSPEKYEEALREVQNLPSRLRVYGEVAKNIYLEETEESAQNFTDKQNNKSVLQVLFSVPATIVGFITGAVYGAVVAEAFDSMILGFGCTFLGAAIGAIPGVMMALDYFKDAETEYVKVLRLAVGNSRPPSFKIYDWPLHDVGLIKGLIALDNENTMRP